MDGDWLFQLPSAGTAKRQLTVLRLWFDSDPAARAIAETEVEEFITVADMLTRMSRNDLDAVCRHLGEGAVRNSELDQRRKILSLLRSWSNPRRREFLVGARRHTGIPPLGDVQRYGSTFTPARLLRAHEEGINVYWLTAFLRMLGREADVPRLLEAIPNGWLEHHIFLYNGRAMMRRILDGASQPWLSPALDAQPAGEAGSALAKRLRQKESALRTLTSDISEGERSRSQWKRTALRTESEVRAQVERARADVAAAAGELQRLRADHQHAMDDLAERSGQRIRHLMERAAEERREFARALAERANRSGAAPLLGWRVAVAGAGAELDTYQLLVESAGGRLVSDAADILIALGGSAAGAGVFCVEGFGLGAFERTLRQQVIPWVLRNRTGRHCGRPSALGLP